MHILNLPDVNYSYHTHVRPQNCSFIPEKAQNKWSTVFAETLGFVFVYNKGSGIHRPQAFFIDFPSAKNSEAVTLIILSLIVLLSLNYLQC